MELQKTLHPQTKKFMALTFFKIRFQDFKTSNSS
jgi:hypothetical protein